MKISHALASVLLLAVLAACSAGGRSGSPPAPDAPASPGNSSDVRSVVTDEQLQVDAAAQPAVDAAVAEFAASAGVDTSEVQVVAVEPVTWPDSSLGCPQPGQSYLQVITPGFKVTLEAGEERAVYHTNDGSMGGLQAVRCAGDGRRQLNLAALSAPALDQARQDLAGRLGGKPQIALLASNVAAVTQLVCPGTAVPTGPGVPAMVVFEFQLQVGAEIHLYRAAGEKILYCGLHQPQAVDEQGNPTE